MIRDFIVIFVTVACSILSLICVVFIAKYFGVNPKELNGAHFVINVKNIITALIVLIIPTIIVLYGNTYLSQPSIQWLGLREFDFKYFFYGLLIGALIIISSYFVRTSIWGVPTITSTFPSEIGLVSLTPYLFWFAVTLILNSISEELVYRVLPLFVTKQYQVNPLLSILTLSILFAGIHFVTRSPSLSDFTYLFLYGLVFCILYLISKSFWFVVGVHTGSNIIAMLFTGHWKMGGFLKIQWPSETPLQQYTLSMVLFVIIISSLLRYKFMKAF